MAYPYVSARETRVISTHFGDPKARTLAGAKQNSRYQGLKKALAMSPDQVVDVVKGSGLRGRGGAGFPTGLKWSFMPKDYNKPHYLCCNADESEPGTFKDREIMRWDPHMLIEGCLIGAYAIRARHAYIYCRGEFFEATQVLAKALEEAYADGLAGDDVMGSGQKIDVTVHVGAGAYICGEETGLMNSLEGRRGQPRVKPPFPAAVGVFGMPTTVNNVETLCAVPHILQNGADWYKQWGSEKSPGTKLFCVSGHVNKPGNYELALGFPLLELIEDVCGGMRNGNALKAVIPGGSSVALLSAEECRTCALDYEGVVAAGSMLGCASVIVMDETTDIVKQVRRMAAFYAHESCGQCTPCREGTSWVTRILLRIEAGGGTEEDLDTLIELTSQMVGTTICVLSDSVAPSVHSSIKKFRGEYMAMIRRNTAAGVVMSDAKPPEMVNLTIDGQSVSVPKGTTILNAAEQIGTRVPHYCYHQGLSSPAMCRLCLVEVEKAPKLQPACVTTVAEGQVVRTQSEKSLTGRRGVLEFYLQNHPLDCPICDQSGECKLQDYAHEEGRFHGRGIEAKRVFGRDDFGGDVLFYGDRCVMCTRCVRFMNEVEQDPRLTVVERGDRSIIDTFFEEGLEGTHFHGNIVDICPVGALLSKDFLFKQRAWDLDHVPSVCPSCSQGCNVELHVRDNAVQRIRPRANLDVNGFWMCDYGRLNYEWINRPERMEVPLVRGERGLAATGWKEALSSLLERLDQGPVKAVVSAHLSNEDLGAVRALVDELGGGEIVYRSARAPDEIPLKGFPTLVRRRDLAPNVNGAQLLGMKRVGADDGTGGLDGAAAHAGVLLVIGDDLTDQAATFGERAGLYVYLGTHVPEAAAAAHFVLPLTTFAEQEGTFTNHENRVQRFWPALAACGAARPAWLVLGALHAERSGGAPATRAEAAFEGIAKFGGLTYETIGTRGAVVGSAQRATAGAAGD